MTWPSAARSCGSASVSWAASVAFLIVDSPGVPDAVQRDARSALWCTADPGPPQAPSSGAAGIRRQVYAVCASLTAVLLAVPGLQRTTLGVRAARAPRLLRCARDTCEPNVRVINQNCAQMMPRRLE